MFRPWIDTTSSIYLVEISGSSSSSIQRKSFNDSLCSLGLSATSQQYCSLIINQHQPPVTNQSAVLFSHNKSAPAISHSQTNIVHDSQTNIVHDRLIVPLHQFCPQNGTLALKQHRVTHLSQHLPSILDTCLICNVDVTGLCYSWTCLQQQQQQQSLLIPSKLG